MEQPDLTPHKAICESILPTIVPENESLETFVASIQDAIKSSLQTLGITATCEVGGSFAKGTNLKGDFDIDMFVAFDTAYKDAELSELLERVVLHTKKTTSMITSFERVHGSRDYFDLTIDGYSVELVPVFAITSSDDVVNVTDMSPLHVHWVREQMKEHDLHNDVRLAKMFCKAAGVYGSESYIQGISGHVLDILIIHYGGFLPLLTHASEWTEPVVIDTMHSYSGTDDILSSLNEAKLKSPLIVIDPIDNKRNAAAALHREKFQTFSEQAHSFLEQPDVSFFKITPFSISSIKDEITSAYAASLPLFFIQADVQALPGNTDRAGAKMKKAYEFLRDELTRQGFSVLASDWHFDKKEKTGTFYYVLPTETLSSTMIREGPPVQVHKNAISFKEKYEHDPDAHITEQNGRYYATIPRPYTKPYPLLQDIIQSSHITSLVRSIRLQKDILE